MLTKGERAWGRKEEEEEEDDAGTQGKVAGSLKPRLHRLQIALFTGVYRRWARASKHGAKVRLLGKGWALKAGRVYLHDPSLAARHRGNKAEQREPLFPTPHPRQPPPQAAGPV